MSVIGRAGRWLAAVRELRPVQVYKRLFFFVKRRWRKLGPFAASATRASGLRDSLGISSHEPVRLTFLGRTVETRFDSIPWHETGGEKLWRYSLQYFDFLVDGQVPDRRRQAWLILDWISRHPDDRAEAWEPYVIARRVCRWLGWLEAEDDLVQTCREPIIDSMIRQGRRLWLDLEEHLQANHLLADLKALFLLSGFLLRSRSASCQRIGQSWRMRVIPLLAREIDSQVLPDGGHEERSPMYHRLMLRDIEEIEREAGVAPAVPELQGLCVRILPGMRSWLEAMTHPDGRFALFQDSACNGFPGADVPMPVSSGDSALLLSASGYFTARWGDRHYLAVACGEPGPAHQPGHSHADALSYELSLWGERWIVDTGCGSYQNPAIRQACRSTAAHNLPMIEGAEQSEIWGEFRMGRRCAVLERTWDGDKRGLGMHIVDAHGNHLYRFMWLVDGSLVIKDTLLKRVSTGRFQSLIHLAPDVTIEPLEGGDPAAAGLEKSPEARVWRLRRGARSVLFELSLPNSSLRTFESCYYPMFGPGIPNTRLILETTADRPADGTEEHLSYVLRYAP